MVVERIVRAFRSGFEGKAQQIGSRPAETAKGFVSLRLDRLVKAADDGCAVLDQAIPDEG